MSVNKDQESIVHDLHESFIFDWKWHVSDFLQDFLQTLCFQQLHDVRKQKEVGALHTSRLSNWSKWKGWHKVYEERAIKDVVLRNLFWVMDLFSTRSIDVRRGKLKKQIHPKDCIYANINNCEGDTSANFISPRKGDCKRRPAGVPNRKRHDHVLEVVQKLTSCRSNDETPLCNHVLLLL